MDFPSLFDDLYIKVKRQEFVKDGIVVNFTSGKIHTDWSIEQLVNT